MSSIRSKNNWHIILIICLLAFSTNVIAQTNSLVAYYPFNGNANDESGNGNDGTVNGAILTTDRFGNTNSAYSFNDNDINIGQGWDTESGSVSMWVNMTGSGAQRFLSDRNSSQDYISLFVNSSNEVGATIYGNIFEDIGQTTVLTQNRWHHIVVNWGAGGMQLFLNGQLNDSSTNTQHWNATSDLLIGNSQAYPSQGWDGKIDDIHIFNQALLEQEIDSLYHIGGWRDYETGTMSDIEGNTYPTVKIGNQWWMAENLKVTQYRNGDAIPTGYNNSQWGSLSTGAYAVYNDDSNNIGIYGNLYNWYAVDDNRSIAPDGWHVPTDTEWQNLINHLGGNDFAGGKMKEIGTTLWQSPNTGATNESGYSALPGGLRKEDGSYQLMGNYATFWSSIDFSSVGAWGRILYHDNSTVYRSSSYKKKGFSIRCIRDSIIATTIAIGSGNVYANDTISIPVSVIFSDDTQYIAAELNFNEYQPGLDFIGIDTVGTMIGGTDWIYSINETDTLMFTAYAGTDNISGTGVFCYLKFVAMGNICSTIPVECVFAKFNSTVTDDISNGEIYIKPIPVYGDVDENTLIEALDASNVLQHVINIDTLDCQGLANADVTNDGTISALDASVILQYVVHLIDSFPYTEPLLAEGRMSFNDGVILPGATVELPLILSNGSNILSFEGELVYNPDHLSFASIEWSSLLSGFTINTRTEEGTIDFAGASANPDGQEGVFATVHFTVNSSFSEDETQVILDKMRLNEGPITGDAATATLVLGIRDEEAGIPNQFALHRNYPNPFNPNTMLRYDLPKRSFVTLTIYDVLGRTVNTLINRIEDPGYKSIAWNATDKLGKPVSAGVYLYRIEARDFIQTRKMILLK